MVKILKGRNGISKEKIASVLALSILHQSCEDLQELLWLISNLIGLSYLTVKMIDTSYQLSGHMGYSTTTTNY